MREEIGYFKEEFLQFIKSHGVISVAIGIVMGSAVAKFISAVVQGVVMPLIEVVLPGQRWEDAALHLGRVSFKIGMVIAALIDFLAIALVVFFFMRYILKIETPKK